MSSLSAHHDTAEEIILRGVIGRTVEEILLRGGLATLKRSCCEELQLRHSEIINKRTESLLVATIKHCWKDPTLVGRAESLLAGCWRTLPQNFQNLTKINWLICLQTS
ncbi:hypothetical protein O6H91_04G069800 [Diphasiastrum complanatum]|uniref:Uncharacterized protein n=1 Tax=Diphasiastrum complanatum TaxID=34168 RepID=A0ACC2DYK3_DIPCM|nr:hypothetical protein O6H91_04G069800 [Diphasiastrum complanatum]